MDKWRRIDIAVFSLSALRKVRDLTSADGHPLMGAGRLYPGWMLPLGLAHEVATVSLLAWFDPPLGVLGCWAFIGGILHAQASPVGPFAHAGPKALIPVAVVCLATFMQASTAESCGPLSRRLGLGRLRPRGMVLLGAATCAAGFGFASMIASANRS